MAKYPTTALLSEVNFDPSETHRLWLARYFTIPAPRLINWLLCNPSTATAEHNDSTLFKVEKYTKAWGYDGFIITNVFSFRARHPHVMMAGPAPNHPDNDHYIARAAQMAELTVAGWSDNLVGQVERLASVLAIFKAANKPLYALRVNASGHPSHPVYLDATFTPQPFTPDPLIFPHV